MGTVDVQKATTDFQQLLSDVETAASNAATSASDASTSQQEAAQSAEDAQNAAAAAQAIDGVVETEGDLPPAADHNGEKWLVGTDSSSRTQAIYESDGTSWTYIGVSLISDNQVVSEVETGADLRNTSVSADATFLQTPSDQAGLFVPKASDPIGSGDDGKDVFQGPDGWWVRLERLNPRDRTVRLDSTDGEADLRTALSEASFGDRILLEPGFVNITVSNGTLTIPTGVTVSGTRPRSNTQDPTLIKAFSGTLLEYNDFVSVIGVVLDGNKSAGHTGDVLAPETANNRECVFRHVTCEAGESAGLVLDETFLTSIEFCTFDSNQDGVSIRGAIHSPHTRYVNCWMTGNTRAGIDIQHSMDRQTIIGGLIHDNKFGIDTTRASQGAPMTRLTTIGDGTFIQANDGPGILLDGTNAAAIRPKINAGAQVRDNNTNVPSGLSTPAGDIHAENGGRLAGQYGGYIGNIRRYNTDGLNGRLTITGEVGASSLPDTQVVVLNADLTELSTLNAASAVGVGAEDGPQLYFTSKASYSESNVTTDRTYDANSTTVDELADVVGTLIADLREKGIVS